MFKLSVCSSDKMAPIHFLRLEFRAHYITGQWSELIKICYLMLLKFDLYFLFFIIKFVFLSFSFLFLMSYQIFATEY